MPCRSKTFKLEPHCGESVESDKNEVLSPSRFLLFKGLFLGMLSGIFYSIVSVLVKDMKNLHPGQLAFYRFVALLIISLPQSVTTGENFLGPKELRFYLLLRGIVGSAHIFFNFIAFRYLPLGEATAIVFSLPVFVTVASKVFLKEPCSTTQSVTVVLTVVGICFTAKLPSRLLGTPVVYTSENVYGLLGALGSLCFNTCQYICIRKVKAVHHSVLMVNFGVISTIVAFLLTLVLGDFKWHYCGMQGFYVMLLGLFSYTGQTMLIMALQCECAGPVSTMKAASDIVLAFFWQTFLFSNTPDMFSIIGALLVGVSVVFVGVSKWVMSLPEDSPQRKRLRWIIA